MKDRSKKLLIENITIEEIYQKLIQQNSNFKK